MTRRILAWIGVVACVFTAGLADAQAVTDAEIQATIERMRAWLYEQQDQETGSWDDPAWPEAQRQSYHTTGETALVTYALLVSGESYQDPRLAKAIDYLQNNRVQGTYLASMRTHIWSLLPEDFAPLLDVEAEYLRRAQSDGRFHYQVDSPTWTNSITHYGTLGLWEYRKRGGEVKDKLWEALAEHMLEQQNDDGGFGYNDGPHRGGGNSTGSMTSAGVVVLQIVQQELARNQRNPDRDLEAAIGKGIAWLDQHFDPAENTGYGDGKRFRFYYLYGIERIALASGLSTLNGRDWFEAGAQFIVEQEKQRGHIQRGRGLDDNSNRIDTAFALLFLSRGRVPLWASKLKLPAAQEDIPGAQAELPGGVWNNRPNDLYFLTQFLSDQREAELNWQVVSVDDDPADWLRAPVLYLSSNVPVELDEQQRANLKRYLDLGGMLLVNPEGRGNRFARSIEDLGRQLYPEYVFENVTAEHPFASLITDLSRGRGRVRPRLQSLSNGVRDLIVLSREDWGYTFQAEEAGRGDAWDYLTNLYATVTDRGRLNNRLDAPLPVRDAERETAGTIVVVRGQHAGNWDAEPAALEIAGIDLFNRTGKELDVRVQPLEQIDVEIEGVGVPALVHLADTGNTELSQDQLAAVKRYVEAGGTLLVESVGGLDTFADDAGGQIAEALGGQRRWIDAFDPIITGEGLGGGADASRVAYRGFSQLMGAPGDRPNLAAIYLNDRPAVILSPRDLSLGALGSRYYRVNGYQTESARALLGNVLLWAEGTRGGP